MNVFLQSSFTSVKIKLHKVFGGSVCPCPYAILPTLPHEGNQTGPIQIQPLDCKRRTRWRGQHTRDALRLLLVHHADPIAAGAATIAVLAAVWRGRRHNPPDGITHPFKLQPPGRRCTQLDTSLQHTEGNPSPKPHAGRHADRQHAIGHPTNRLWLSNTHSAHFQEIPGKYK